MSALSSFYGPSLTLGTQRPPLLGRRRFSSACKIAQITFMGYPPKIQPQASALRGERRRSQAPNSIKTDNLVSLDALDEEAGCILLALSNHKYENVESLPKTMASSDAASSSSSASDSGSPSKSSPSDGNSMSINNLLGSSDGDAAGLASPVPNTQGGPAEDPIVQSSTKELAHVSKAERPPPFAPFDPESDPIMILAAAAAAVNDEDRKRQSQDESGASEPPRQKRKWQAYYGYSSSSSSSSNNNNNNGVNDEQPDMHPEKRHRYQQPASSLLQDSTWHEKVPATQAEEGLKFSSHYMSMKENPKIKRNAMHAYITYMIYTNMSHENSASATDSSKVATQSAKIARTDSPLPSSSHHYGPPPPPPSTLSRPNDEVPDARSSSDKADLSAAARVPLERAAAYSTSSPSSHTGLQNFADYNSHRNNSSSSWYPPSSYQQQQAPPPPVTHSPRALALSSSAIVDRPLTAFLWDDKKSERKDSSLALPPFNAPPPPPPSLAPQQQTTPATSPQL